MPGQATPIPCYFDGACRRNQFADKGPMRAAYVVADEEHVHEVPDVPSDRGPRRSNNIAEYHALILLLRRLHERRPSHPGEAYVIRGDSQLVVGQMEGRYRVRDEKLRPLHDEARRLAADLPVVFRWVPRTENRAGHLLE